MIFLVAQTSNLLIYFSCHPERGCNEELFTNFTDNSYFCLTGTTFCGNSPVDPSLLNLVKNEVLLLSSNLDEFVEQKDELESQLLGVKRSLDQLVELPQEVEQIKDDVESLKQQVADQELEQIKDDVESLKQQVADQEVEQIKDDVESLKQQVADQEVEQIKDDVESLKQQVADQDVEQIKDDVESLKQQVADQEVEQIKDDVESLKQQVADQDVEQIRDDVESLKQQVADQEVEQIKDDVESLKQQVADLRCNDAKSEERTKHPVFFGALDRNEYFTGRKKILETLERAFDDVNVTENSRGVPKRGVNIRGICGLGGCGKSSLALEYAWRNMERYPGGVFVVNGESDDLMRVSLQGIHEEFVEVDSTQSNKFKEGKSFEDLLTESLSWLGNLTEKWLLLVDNLDQKELSSCARKLFFGQWKSKTSGDILVTSRRTHRVLCEDLRLSPENCYELDLFSVSESTEFLDKRTGIQSSCEDEGQGKKELAEELGGLPLALEQAAAYIKALECPIPLYLQQYRSQKAMLLSMKSAIPHTEIYNEERLGVQTTWLLNFYYITNCGRDKGLGRAAAFFMKIAAYLFPDDIPIDVLNVGAPEIEPHEDLKKRLEMPLGAQQIVDLLIKFSLFKRKSDDTLSIHRLVQETLRDRCNREGETDNVLSSAVGMMHQAFLNCIGGAEFLSDFRHKMTSMVVEKPNPMGETVLAGLSLAAAPLEGRRWRNLSKNAFYLVCNLFKDSPLKTCFFCEASARLSCEAALFCYSIGMDFQAYRLQQFVFEIICAVKEPIRYYKNDDLLKVTRVSFPCGDGHLISCKLNESADVREKTNDRTLETIKVIESKAREAFSKGDFQTSVELYSDIVRMSNLKGFRGSFKEEYKQPHLVPVGEILCRRGITHLQMGNYETAVDDFSASTHVNIQHYRGYYWKVYALCKLVESGRTELTSRAQAAMAVLNFKFANSKPNDIRKLQTKFPGILDRIEYKFVSQVSELKELERLVEVQSDFSNSSLTIILDEGHYDLKRMTLSDGQYYFVCLPGSIATVNCLQGLYLSHGSFMFENIRFVNIYSIVPLIARNTTLLEDFDIPAITTEKGVEDYCASQNFDTLTLGGPHLFPTELTAATEQNPSALIEANDVQSLVIDHCAITGAACTGIKINFTKSSRGQNVVSVRSSSIRECRGTGLHIQGKQFCHIILDGNDVKRNVYGIVIDSPSSFYLDKNFIAANTFSGLVVINTSEGGRLLRNSVTHNGKHGVLLNKANAVVEENVISDNRCWGVVCCSASNLQFERNVLDRNFCGGLRVILNGKGNVLVQKCQFSQNFGPAIFPRDSNERCHFEREFYLQLSAAPTSRKIIVPLYLRFLLEDTILDHQSMVEFKSPVVNENKVSEASKALFEVKTNSCCTCCKDLQLNGDPIECPNCHVARYCDQECFDMAKPIHHSVCKAILAANKECVNFKLLKLNDTPPLVKKGDVNGGAISFCVIASLNVSPPFGPNSDMLTDYLYRCKLCLMICPQLHLCSLVYHPMGLTHYFVARHGRHLPDQVMGIKAACVLANFDLESETITLYYHRIFPLEKIPDALNWVDRAMRALEQDIPDAPQAPRKNTGTLKKRQSRKRKQRFR